MSALHSRLSPRPIQTLKTMKKTISINISGINFYIEEDGFEKLNAYLASIHRYFSTFEGNEEIISDIEARIAEIFSQRLSPAKQAITLEDVDSVIATMGNISDFQEIEDPTETSYRYTASENTSGTGPGTTNPYTEPNATAEASSKRLYRDTKRKIIGGVAAGIANYFVIDPLWIRLILVVLVLFTNRTIRILGSDDIFLFNNSLSGLIILAYIICWVVVPGRGDIQPDENIKKLFRDPDGKVIGGVCGGLASYFGADIIAVRLLFIILFFLGGFGLLLYVILWIITPEAKSLTDKMKMQGEPLTLANIEANIKSSLNIKPGQEESTAAKVLLFPFRLIAIVFNRLVDLLGPLMTFIMEAIRIAAGIMLILLSFALMIASIALFGVTRGLISDDSINFGDFPIEAFYVDLPWYTALCAFVATFIPALMLGVGGLSLIAKRKIMNTIVGWTLFAIWLVALLGASLSVGEYISNFRSVAEVEQTSAYKINSDVLYLNAKDTAHEDDYAWVYDNVELRIRGHEADSVMLVKVYSARGKNKRDATNYASSLIYEVTQEDSVITFNTSFSAGNQNPFRVQDLKLELYIPYEQIFEMDPALEDILRSTLSPAGYSKEDIANNRWKFTKEGLQCLTCQENKKTGSRTAKGAYTKEFNYSDFDRVNIGSAFKVNITQGDKYEVKVSGPSRYVENVTFKMNGNELEAYYKGNRRRFNVRNSTDRIYIDIVMPAIRAAAFHGATNANITGFNNDHLSLKVSGAATARVDVNTQSTEVELSGASELLLRGRTKEFEADISGASQLKSQDFVAEVVTIEASGASSARVHATQRLDAEANGASSIRYRGNPREVNNDSGHGSSITRD